MSIGIMSKPKEKLFLNTLKFDFPAEPVTFFFPIQTWRMPILRISKAVHSFLLVFATYSPISKTTIRFTLRLPSK